MLCDNCNNIKICDKVAMVIVTMSILDEITKEIEKKISGVDFSVFFTCMSCNIRKTEK